MIAPELMLRMLLVGYLYGLRSEQRLVEEVRLNLAYRWFCGLVLDKAVPDASTFSTNRHGRFRDAAGYWWRSRRVAQPYMLSREVEMGSWLRIE